MSALETLAPDQRAVLQLILRQGRGYAELATLLRIDEAAVRARAHAGLAALGVGGEALSPQRRAQVADWLLGQQDDAARRATVRYLGDSVAARRWAAGLRERLAPLAAAPLPEIPAPAGANGHAPAPAADGAAPDPATPAPPADPAPADGDGAAAGDDRPAAGAPAADAGDDASAAAPPARQAPDATAELDALAPDAARPATEREAADDDAPPPDAPPAADPDARAPARPAARPRRDAGRERPRSSRLGGAILLVGMALLVAVLAIVLIGGGDDEQPVATAPAATQPRDDGDGASAGRTTGAAGGGQVLTQVNLNPTAAGGEAAGIGWVQRVDGRPMIAIQVANVAPNGERDVYAAWLRTGRGATRFLGFVPSQVGRDRAFTVSSTLPRDIARYDEVLITREAITSTATPRSPGEIVLAGRLRLRG